MADAWFYRNGDNEFGPLTFGEIVELASSGKLSPQDEVKSEKSPAWMKAESVVGLFPEPEELQNLDELDIEFVDSKRPTAEATASSASNEPAEVSALDELNIKFVSDGAVRKSSGSTQRDSTGGQPDHAAADSAGDSESEEPQWYYQSLGVELGPMTLQEMVRIAADGVLERSDKVRCGLRGEWQEASGFPELRDALSTSVDSDDDDFVLKPTVAPSAPLPQKSAGTVDTKDKSRQDDRTADDRTIPEEPVDDESSRDDAPAEPAAEPAEPAAERWFCRFDGVEHGPLSTEELTAMARHGRLTRWTQVRRGDAGSWVQASTIEEIAADLPPPSEHPAASTAGPSSSPAAVPGGAPPQPYVRPKRQKEKKPRGPREPVFDKLKDLVSENAKAILVGIGLVAVIGMILVFGMGAFDQSNQEYADALQEILDEHQALRERNADSSEWEPLKKKATALREEILPKLEKTASAKRPIRQHLLFATRDYMLPMLEEAQKEPTEEEKWFIDNLERAKALIKDPDAQFEPSEEQDPADACCGGGEADLEADDPYADDVPYSEENPELREPRAELNTTPADDSFTLPALVA